MPRLALSNPQRSFLYELRNSEKGVMVSGTKAMTASALERQGLIRVAHGYAQITPLGRNALLPKAAQTGRAS